MIPPDDRRAPAEVCPTKPGPEFQRGLEAERAGDLPAAAGCYRQGAEQGDPHAAHALATLILAGTVPGSEGEALLLTRQAAQARLPAAAFNLGVFYFNGQRVSQDKQQAAAWFRLAAEGGSARGQYYLARQLYEGDGIPRDIAWAARLMEAAARQGLTNAAVDLAMMYAMGQASAQPDGVLAYAWVTWAQSHGHPEAERVAGVIEQQLKLTAEQRRQARALARSGLVP